MTIILWILLTFIVFLIVVLIHELWHFATARWTGMKVEEFGFGIPPRIKKVWRDKKGTDYTFNSLPIGWFVRILGEDSQSLDKDKPGAFMTKKWPARVLVLIAGVTMNFFLAWIIFSWLFMFGARPVTISPFSDEPTGSVFIPSFTEARDMWFVSYSGIILSPLTGSAAYMAGIREGDILLSIDGKDKKTREEIIEMIRENRPLDIMVLRDANVVPMTLIPDKGKVGMYINYQDLKVDESFVIKKSIPSSLVSWAKETYATSVLTLWFLGQIIQKTFVPKDDKERASARELLSGPVGVGTTFVNMVKAKVPISLIFLVIALLSVNLWVVNILPFPALDGGRIVTTTIFSILSYFPKASSAFAIFERMFHLIGFIFLLFLMLMITGIDISRLFS